MFRDGMSGTQMLRKLANDLIIGYIALANNEFELLCALVKRVTKQA